MFSKCIHILQKQPQIDTPGWIKAREMDKISWGAILSNWFCLPSEKGVYS